MKNLGKRKCAIANVELVPGTGKMEVNNLTEEIYFQKQYSLISMIWLPLKKIEVDKKFDILVQVNGGGKSAQASAIQLGVARTIKQKFFENKKFFQETNQISTEKGQSLLKKENYLTRDPRVKERRKYGLKKARKSSQFSKR